MGILLLLLLMGTGAFAKSGCNGHVCERSIMESESTTTETTDTPTPTSITTTPKPYAWLAEKFCYNKTDEKFYPENITDYMLDQWALSWIKDNNPCEAISAPTTSTTAITETFPFNTEVENGTITRGNDSTPTENTTSSEKENVSTTTMAEPVQLYPCYTNYNGYYYRVVLGNGTRLNFSEADRHGIDTDSLRHCRESKPPTGTNSSTTAEEIPDTTSTVSMASTTSTTSSTTSTSTASTTTLESPAMENGTTSTSSTGTTVTPPAREPKNEKTISTQRIEATDSTSSFGTGTSETPTSTTTSTTGPFGDSETDGTTPTVETTTDISEEDGSTMTDYSTESESETTSVAGGSTWINRREDSFGKGDGEKSTTSTEFTGTVFTATTDGKTAGATSTTLGPNGSASTTIPPVPSRTETGSATSPSPDPLPTGTEFTTSTTAPGHSSSTASDTATETESTKVSPASNGTTPAPGTSEGVSSTGVRSESTEKGSDENGSTDTESIWSSDAANDGTSPISIASDGSTPKEEKSGTSTSPGQSTGTTSSGHSNVTASTVTPAANATSPNSTASTSPSSGKVSATTTSPDDVTDAESSSTDSSSDFTDSSLSSTVSGNVSTTLSDDSTTESSSSSVPESSLSSPSNASPSSPASVPTSSSPSTSKTNSSSSTTPGAQNATNEPAETSPTSPGTTAPPGSAGKILWETAVSYPNCSVLLTSTLAYSNGTKSNVTKWVDVGCGKGWETTLGNNMINQDGAIVVSQVCQAFDDCTVDVSQLLKYPNGSEFNMTTTYASDCSILTPDPENSSPSSAGSNSSTTPSSVSGKEKILATSARSFPNCTVVITTTVQYPNKTIANTSKSVDQKCGSSFDTGVKDVVLPDGTKIRSERGTVYDNCTLLIQQELEYVNGTQGTKDNWLGDPCLSTTPSPSTTASTAPTGRPSSETSGTIQGGLATTPKAIKVTAKIIAVKATSLPNCTVVITQTMQYSNGTIVDTVKTVDQKCGGNFTVDYSDQNLTMPDGGRLLSSNGSSYGNCSLAVTNKIQYPNNTMTNPTTWYNDSCNSASSTTGLPASKPVTVSSIAGATSTIPEGARTTNPPQNPVQSPGTATVLPNVGASSERPSSSPTSASAGSVAPESLLSTTPGSTPLPSTIAPQCLVNSFQNDSANTILVNGTNMVHTCKSGYIFPDGASMKMSECVNGVWKGLASATCQPNSCPPLTISLKNARTPQLQDSVMASRQPIGTMVVHSCSTRHVFPSGEPMRIYDCIAGGIWKGKINSDECQHVDL